MLGAEHGTFLLAFMVDQGDQLGERAHGGGRQARPRMAQIILDASFPFACGFTQTRTVTFRRYPPLQ